MRPPLHPRHGPHQPTGVTPPRRPGSVRRTTTITMLRPEGVFGPVHLLGQGRDLVTTTAGTAQPAVSAVLRGEVDYLGTRQLTVLESEPAEPALAGLVGQRVSSGFRNRVDDALPDHRDAESLLYQLLDDLPVATLISGYVLSTVPLPPTSPSPTHPNEDVCAGWRRGGTIMVGIAETGRPPLVTGPQLTSLLPADDPLAWHDLDPLPPHGMRRHRRLDAWRDHDGVVRVDCFFRDTHMDVNGVETAIHEYAVTAAVDPDSLTIVDGRADPRVLPWVECPPAAASAHRVAGRSLHELRTAVRTEFTGTTTCTHLNDQLRSLAGLRALLPLLE